METSAFTHDPELIAGLDRFVSINSALEIDLGGQVTAESLGARQVAGIGGQFDFVLGASRSAGGVSIIALPSTGRDGAVSRIVPQLAAGAAVTTPRYLTDYVVTEQGAARLRGLSDRARPRRWSPWPTRNIRGAGACAQDFFLALSICSKISSSVGKRYVSLLL
jgi:4-hydroxybutyrate CoA-transferase